MSEAPDDLLRISPDPDIAAATVTLRRTSRANALNGALVDALTQALTGIARRQDSTGQQQLLRIASEARAFCAGFDLTEAQDQTEGDILLRFVRIETLLQDLRRGPVASMAIIDGAAYGAGADLAAACTWRVGTARARFRFPGFGFGVALGTRHLAAIVGHDKARQILAEDRVVTADEALDCGLLTHLVTPEQLDATVADLSRLPARMPPGAFRRMLALTGEGRDDADMAAMVRSLAEPGLKGRIAAYLERGKS